MFTAVFFRITNLNFLCDITLSSTIGYLKRRGPRGFFITKLYLAPGLFWKISFHNFKNKSLVWGTSLVQRGMNIQMPRRRVKGLHMLEDPSEAAPVTVYHFLAPGRSTRTETSLCSNLVLIWFVYKVFRKEFQQRKLITKY